MVRHERGMAAATTIVRGRAGLWGNGRECGQPLHAREQAREETRKSARNEPFYFAENFDKFSIVIRCAAIAMVHGVG